MYEERKKQFNRLLESLADSLDIPESRFKDAEDRYRAVGQWLGEEGSPLASYSPEIYPQGSFLLGTVVKPISDEDEYDIDLVCKLEFSKKDVTQKQLKEMVGNRLKLNKNYERMLDKKEGRRCWTLHYADGARFHMDILPAIPDDMNFKLQLVKSGVRKEWTYHAICITDKTHWNYDLHNTDWPSSNPTGYSEWFRERMKIQLETQRKLLSEKMRADIEDVPEFRIKTPLQRSIQLLKRHRDIMFKDDPDDKPISIIITTLAALAYDNQAELYEALVSIVGGMPNHIQKVNGISLISNPVNPKENFADKWKENPQRELKFRNWLLRVKLDLESAIKEEKIQRITESLKCSFGAVAVQNALSSIESGTLEVNPRSPKSRPEIVIRNPSKPWRRNGY